MIPSIPCSEEEYYYKLDNMVLSSTQHLRKVFRSRYKTETGKEWIDEQDHVHQFFEGATGRHIIQKTPPNQKTRLLKCTEEWDMSLLWIVLKNFGVAPKSAWIKENDAVAKLKTIRNKLAHHPTKKIPKSDYDQSVQVFKSALADLGMELDTITKLTENAGVTSSVKAFDSVTKLFTKAEETLANGSIPEAGNYYTQAIQMPSLLPSHLGVAYEKRAEYYLNLVKDPIVDREHCDRAFLDVKVALELNEASWTAHFLAAQCYRYQNDVLQAIEHYQRALAISPAQHQVKEGLTSCKILAGGQKRQEHLHPHMMPVSLREYLTEVGQKTGTKMSEQTFLKLTSVSKKAGVKGQNDVVTGLKHFRGWGVPQNATEAVKYYLKAAKCKNLDGMALLGLCYYNGFGVEQNVPEALRLYKEVAIMDAHKKNKGTISCAQHALGLIYEEGIGVEVDYEEAAKWYEKAMKTDDCGPAANNLGLLYFLGRGVAQDKKMAELLWKKATSLKEIEAPASLANYYLGELEPDEAVKMVQIGRQLGNPELLKLSDAEFYREIERMKAFRRGLEDELVQFEQDHNLASKGLTFGQRYNRQLQHTNPTFLMYKDICENKGKAELNLSRDQLLTANEAREIRYRALEGSKTAQEIWETLSTLVKIAGMLQEPGLDTELQRSKVVDLLYHYVTGAFHVTPIAEKSRATLKNILQEMFDVQSALKSERDMKVRLCYVALNLRGASHTSKDMYDLEVIKEGLRRYPGNVHYHIFLSNLFLTKRFISEGKRATEEALALFPDNTELLYNRALYLFFLYRGSPEDPSEIIEAFQKFIQAAPHDHRKVPEAYFKISGLYTAELPRRGPDHAREVITQVYEFFHRGQEAEENQMPCYLPYRQGDAKRFVISYLNSLVPDEAKAKPISTAHKQLALPNSVLERKEYLKNPIRKALILEHRKNFFRDRTTPYKIVVIVPPKLEQRAPRKMSAVRPITLNEMNPAQDQIFGNRMIDLTVLDDPNPHAGPIRLLVEDDNGDVTRLRVYKLGKDATTLESFQIGCRLGVLNPYVKVDVHGVVDGIRVYEPACIVYLEKAHKMCGFCGEQDAASACGVCSKAYCSRECQQLDWKELKHKHICSKRV